MPQDTITSSSPDQLEPWKDIDVDSWNHLLRVLHSLKMIPKKEEQGWHHRSSFVFRGMSSAEWPLKTSLERLGSPPENVEQPALRAFSRYAPIGTVSLKSEWDRLAVAQHNGLPTRVLDWTVSPLVAAHFATEEKEYRIGKTRAPGLIWCVNADVVRGKLIPKEMGEYLCCEKAYVYNVPMLDALYPRLSDFDSPKVCSGDMMIFFEPPSIDARIQNQFGILSAMNGPTKSHDAYLRQHAQHEPNLVRRIIIAPDAKSHIRDMLDQNNITERMLFPGLPGLCDWLARYYGPA
ncbi:MAG: FRG domain-containing protein [Pyrinomonadaceae bacterium]